MNGGLIFAVMMCLPNPPANLPADYVCKPLVDHTYSTLADCQQVVDRAKGSFTGYDVFCAKKEVSLWQRVK